MAISQIAKIKAILNKFWDGVWSTIKDHTFNVKTDIVIPEFPEIKIPEVKIPEQLDTRTELKEIVNTIIKQTQELKISPDSSATKKQLLTTLLDIKTILSKDVKDFTPDLVAEIQALRSDLSKIGAQIPKTDLKPLGDRIDALKEVLDLDKLKKFQRYTDWRVYINEKQFERLTKAMSVSVSAAGGGVLRNTAGEITPDNPLNIIGDIEITQEKESSANANTAVSVGSSSTTVIAANSDRRFALIVNDSDEEVYLKLGSGATMNSGIRINANGGSYLENIYTGIITGICASGSKNVTVVEV